jgi:hypothetical protein
MASFGTMWHGPVSSSASPSRAPARGPPWIMVPPGLPTRGLGPPVFLLKNILFSIIFRETYTEAHVLICNSDLALSFVMYLIASPCIFTN